MKNVDAVTTFSSPFKRTRLLLQQWSLLHPLFTRNIGRSKEANVALRRLYQTLETATLNKPFVCHPLHSGISWKRADVLERQTTRLRKPISVEKRVAVGLYRLCSSAQDRTIAHLFGIGRSTVNVLYREFCKAVISQLEMARLHMIRQEDMRKHLREFFAFSGFSQGIGALGGCHFRASPPKENAVDYYN